MLLFLSYCANVLAAAPKTTVTIAPGVDMPLLNLGTCCGSDPKAGLEPWLDQGGVGIDTAFDYNDQKDIGAILEKRGLNKGAKRKILFITSKVHVGCQF
jgi:diketogulonate reductase-like aldo/keto reductase